MIRVRVTDTGSRQLRKLKDNLRSEDTASVLSVVPTSTFEQKVLEYMELITPHGDHIDERESRGYVPQGVSEKHLEETWRAKREYSGNQLYVRFYSLLETIGGRRGQAKLASIEFGSRRMLVPAPRDFKFKGDYSWVRYADGENMLRPAREGLGIMKKTSEFIENALLPSLRLNAKSILTARISRFS